MKDLLEELNEKQREVVLSTHGPVLVLAGAGSGKTRALTHRAAHLIQTGLAAPHQILAVTFTNKAAATMKARLQALLPTHAQGAALSTFHGLGARILREQASHISRSSRFLIFDSQDSERAIRLAMKAEGASQKEWSPKQIKHKISQAKNSRLTPADMTAGAQSPIDILTARIYGRYQQILAQQDAYDFDDLLLAPLELLEASPALQNLYQRRWPFISVDEYQDTNPIQEQLLRLLLGPEQHLCVVGDDYQAIYSWRGAKVDHILHFQSQFPSCKTIYLTQNYRSTPQILAAANQVIAANRKQMHKELWTQQTRGEAVKVVALPSDLQEAIWIRQQIEEHTARGGKRAECAILYRTNAQSRLLEEQFLRYGIPYTIVGGFRFYERREIKDALAWLQLYINPNSGLSLRRLVEVLCRGIGPQTLAKWEQLASSSGQSLLQLASQAAQEKPTLRPITQTLASAHSRQWANLGDLLRFMLEQSGYFKQLQQEPDGIERRENIDELLNLTAAYTQADAFLGEVALLSDLDTLDEQQDRIICMTLHAAKGLEFPYVWVVGCEEGLLPHINSLDNQASLEEERRLLYVGMTRAQRKLTLSYAATRALRGELVPQLPSRFFQELPETVERFDSLSDTVSTSWLAPSNSLENDQEPVVIEAEVGDFVSHHIFGRGVVIGISRQLCTCIFEGHGVKTVDGSSLQTEHGITY